MNTVSDLRFWTNLAAVVPHLIRTKPHSLESLREICAFLFRELSDVSVSYVLVPEVGISSQLAYVLANDSLTTASLDKLETAFAKKMKLETRLFFRFVSGTKDDAHSGSISDLHLVKIKDKDDPQATAAIIAVATHEHKLTSQEKELIEASIHYFCQITKKVQQVIDQEQTVVENLVTSMADAVVVFNTQKEITLINDQSLAMFKAENGDQPLNLVKLLNLLYQLQLQVTTKTEPVDLAKIVVQVVSQQSVHRTEKVRLPQGVFEVTVMPIADHTKQVVGGAILFHDITKTEELSQAKSEFIRVASHRLRTPLSSQRWNFELLLGGDVAELEPEAQELLVGMQHVNMKMIDMTEDLLQVSNYEAGMPVDTSSQTELDPSKVVDQVVKRYQAEAELRSISISRTHREEETVKVRVQPHQLQQAIGHVLLNAIFYNKSGGQISVTTTTHDGYFKISIKDSGIGISAEDQEKLFTKFFRGQEATKMYTDGTGVGLFLTKLFVEAWGGTLTVTSTEGEGTSVQFTIPTI